MTDVKTNIPDEYANEFINLVKKMETKTGNSYELIIKQFGSFSNHDLILCDFKKRQNYIVFDMNNNYKELEGCYENVNQIYEKLESLTYPPTSGTIKIKEKLFRLWKCPKCDKSGNDKSPNTIGNVCCQNCEYRIQSKWDGISVGIHEGNIYSGRGGSICKLTKIGKVKFS